MKIAILIARILLGLVFFASGLTSLLHVFKLKPDPANDATVFLTLLTTHNYMTFIALLMVVAGLLLLVGRFVPLGLVILGPILVNILLFHILFAAPGIITGLICSLFEIFLIWAYRFSFRGLFDAAPEVS